MHDRTYDAIYELLYDTADDVINEQVLGRYGDSEDTESVDELRSYLRGAVLSQVESIMQRALDDYDAKDLVDRLRTDAKMSYVETQVGEIYWNVEIRRRGNHHLVDGFTCFGTLESVCSMMDGCLEGNEKVGDTSWCKLEAVIYAGVLKVAVMPCLDGPDYEIVCDIDTNKPLDAVA